MRVGVQVVGMRAPPGFSMFGASASSRIRPRWPPGRSRSRGPDSGSYGRFSTPVPRAWQPCLAPGYGGFCGDLEDPGSGLRQALLIIAHVLKGETFAELAAGFEVGVPTAVIGGPAPRRFLQAGRCQGRL
jgi:hypothetical protein